MTQPRKMKPPRRDMPAVTIPRCPNCGSTKRTKYFWVERAKVRGVDQDGLPVDECVRKTTDCTACGHRRVDRFLEYSGPRDARVSSGTEPESC